MNSDTDRDLTEWTADWHAAPYDAEKAEQIRHYVKRRTGLLWSFAVIDFVVGGLSLPVLVYLAVVTGSDIERQAMIALTAITVAAVMFGWWNWRGVLRSAATTVSDYVEISAERFRRMRMAWRIGWIVLAAYVAVYSIWIWDRLYLSGPPPSPGQQRFAWGWLGTFSVVAIVALAKFGRWLDRDMQRFEALKRDLADGATLDEDDERDSGPAKTRRGIRRTRVPL
jgi:hypothetical protein